MAIKGDRKLNSINAIDALTDLFILRGAPAFIRSDNGPEFIAQAIRDWIAAVGLRRLTSSQDAPEKTDTARASMAGSETNCSTERSSIAYGKYKSSSKNGGDTTIRRDHTVH